jgi:DNA primase
MTAVEYLQAKGFEYRLQSGQAVLKTCPFCGDQKSHFYMDQNEGAFYCHKCQERGNLLTLKKHLGDFNKERHSINQSYSKPQGAVRPAFPDKDTPSFVPDEKKATQAHERLLTDPDAMNYVTQTRGISIETVKAFKIGLQIGSTGGRWLAIPHYERGKLVNIKSRSLPPAKKDFRRVKDCRSVLFNGDTIEAYGNEIYIAEGEIDALTLIDQGINNAVGITTGAGSFDPEWIDQLQTVKKIILCYDPDEAGQKGAREAARRLGYDRCFNVVLPEGQDVNEYFTGGHDLFEFQSIVNQARQFDVAGIMTFADALKQYQ